MKRIFTILLVITILTAMMKPVHSFGAAAGTPTVELTKTTYKVGEDIVGSYADYTSNYWGRSRADIVIYKKGDVVGQSSNLGGYSVYIQMRTSRSPVHPPALLPSQKMTM